MFQFDKTKALGYNKPKKTKGVDFMLIDFELLEKVLVPNLNGGVGELETKTLYIDKKKMMLCTVPKGASIGYHKHDESAEIFYVVSGKGKVLCNGDTEELRPGVCHYCPRFASHGLENTSEEDLVLFKVIIE